MAPSSQSELCPAYVGRGNIYRQQGQFDQAMGDYEQAIKSSRTRPGLSQSRPDPAGPGAARARHRRFHLRAVERSAAPEPYYARGTSYLALGKYKEAFDDFNSSLQIDNKNAAAWTGRGLAQEGRGDRQKARESFQRALQLNPYSQPAKDGIGRTGLQAAG